VKLPATPLLVLWLPRLLVLLLALHFGRAVLPFAPVEGDDVGVIKGVEARLRGTGDFNAVSYLYPIQPGSYHVLHGLSLWSGQSALSVFGFVTAAGAAGFVLFASLLLARATALRPAWVAVALLLAPELVNAACYANTSAPAGALAMAGLAIAQRAESRRSLWLAGVVLGLGGWLRMDSLLISPAALGLRLLGAEPRRAWRETSEMAAAGILTLVTACAVSSVSWHAAWEAFTARDNLRDWRMLRINGGLVLGYATTLICLAGIFLAGWARQWRVLTLILAGVLPSLAVYGGNFTTPKYLYYAAPFLLLPGLALTAGLLRSANFRRVGLGVVLLLFPLAETTAGIQSASAFRRFDPQPLLLAAPLQRLGGKSFTVGLGEGEILPTADGPRLRGGQLWSPAFWRREKTAILQEIARLDRLLATGAYPRVLTSTYLSYQLADAWLRQHGYTAGPSRAEAANPSTFAVDFTRPGTRMTLVWINQTEADATEFSQWSDTRERLLFLNDRGRLVYHRLSGGAGGWRLLSPGENGLLTIYERPEQENPPSPSLR
jgi:hypothetical protein